MLPISRWDRDDDLAGNTRLQPAFRTSLQMVSLSFRLIVRTCTSASPASNMRPFPPILAHLPAIIWLIACSIIIRLAIRPGGGGQLGVVMDAEQSLGHLGMVSDLRAAPETPHFFPPRPLGTAYTLGLIGFPRSLAQALTELNPSSGGQVTDTDVDAFCRRVPSRMCRATAIAHNQRTQQARNSRACPNDKLQSQPPPLTTRTETLNFSVICCSITQPKTTSVSSPTRSRTVFAA